MKNTKTLLILGAGPLQLPAYIQAANMGIKTVGVDMDPHAAAFKYANIKVVESTINSKKVLDKVKDFKIDGVMTLASDMPMRTVALIAKELNLESISVEAANCATDKILMRKKLKQANIPIPKFIEINEFEEILSEIQNFKSKLIFKPSDNSGSRGVRLVEDITEVNELKDAFEYSKSFSRSGKIIVEEFMEGVEVSVESLTVEGITTVVAITDKYTSGSPYFVESGHLQPTELTMSIQEEIINLTVDSLKALQIESGPSHTEIIVTNAGPKIVEIGARLGGDNITTHLVPLSTGVNLVEQTIKLVLNLRVNLERKATGSAIIKYIFSEKEGYISRIVIPEEIKKQKGLVEIVMNKTVGDYVTKTKNSTERLGHIIVGSNTIEEGKLICESLISRIVIEIE